VKLRRRGFEDGVAEKTVAWLEERGLVDDRRYVAAVVRERLKAGWGRRRIVSELLRKGVARDLVVGEAWDGLRDEGVDEDGFGVALALARRRFGCQLAADPVGTKRRVAAFLGRRGHDWDTIGRVTRQLCTEIGDEEGTEPPAVD
jgi:regulatory protein